MSEITFTPEFVVLVTEFEKHPADPSVGALEEHFEINEIEIRDGDDKLVNIPGLKDYVMEAYGDDLAEVVAIANEADEREAAETEADHHYQSMKDEGYGSLSL